MDYRKALFVHRSSFFEVRKLIVSYSIEPITEIDEDTYSTYTVILSRMPTAEEQDELLDLELELGMAEIVLHLEDGTSIPMTNVYNF